MAPSEHSPRAAALDYACRGWAVTPINSGSTGASRDAWTVDPETVREWFPEEPGVDVGIVTGPASDLAVLIVRGAEGHDQLDWLETAFGMLPDTYIAGTAGSEVYFYFSIPRGCHLAGDADELGGMSGLDLKCAGTVVAPSAGASNGAFWIQWELPEKVSLAALPEVFLMLYRSSRKHNGWSGKAASAQRAGVQHLSERKEAR